MNLRSMRPEEQKYTYAQSHQLSMLTGFIGHLRADMDTDGNGFFSSWNRFRDDLKTDEFKHELDELINELRKEGNLLHNRSTLSRHCHLNLNSSYKNNRNEYGFRVDTEIYSYLMRVNPNRGEYNLYCYCFVKKWINQHLYNAAKGIRFITPEYKDVFQIPDGDKIRIVTKDGEYRDRTCRYIDDQHMETSGGYASSVYHICEFAERLRLTGAKVLPLRSSLPEKCYSVLDSTGELIVLTKGEAGYHPAEKPGLFLSARTAADRGNKLLGVTKAQEEAMKVGSLFGFEVPGADPKNYDENGYPLRKSRQMERNGR